MNKANQIRETKEQEEQGPEKKLERRLTPFNVWSLAFGCVIGFGSFIMPGTTFLKQAGPLGSMLALEAAAFIMLIISYSYHYMICRFPVSGGQFIYAKAAFGKTHGFICAWFLSLCYLCIIPMNATALELLARTLFGDAFQFGFHYTLAGYDVYLGEVLLAVAALLLFAFIDSRGIHFMGKVQTLLAALLLGGILTLLAAAVFRPGALGGSLHPLFHPGNRSRLLQVFSVMAVAPWAFVGFDTVPLLAEESKFSTDAVKVVMDTCILCGCFVYVALTFLAAAALPVGYSDWPGYIYGLQYTGGLASIPTLYAAYRLLGNIGLIVWGLAAMSAMLTGIVGFYVATSRLLYSLARDGMLPRWFGVLNRNSAPVHATLFCMGVSLLAPFMGRTALGWTVDMSSIGGAISFAYTSLAAWKYARREGRRDIVIFGGLGFVFSVIFALLLLIPIPALDCSLSRESYLCLILWIILGTAFFFRTQR